jgi:hypothetical protein
VPIVARLAAIPLDFHLEAFCIDNCSGLLCVFPADALARTELSAIQPGLSAFTFGLVHGCNSQKAPPIPVIVSATSTHGMMGLSNMLELLVAGSGFMTPLLITGGSATLSVTGA